MIRFDFLDFLSQCRAVQAQHMQQVSALEAQLSASSGREAALAAQLSAEEEAAAGAAQQAQEQLAEQAAAHAQQLAAAQAQHEQQLRDLQAEHAQQVSDFQAQLRAKDNAAASAAQQAELRLAELGSEHAREVAATQAQHSRRVGELEAAHAKQVRLVARGWRPAAARWRCRVAVSGLLHACLLLQLDDQLTLHKASCNLGGGGKLQELRVLAAGGRMQSARPLHHPPTPLQVAELASQLQAAKVLAEAAVAGQQKSREDQEVSFAKQVCVGGGEGAGNVWCRAERSGASALVTSHAVASHLWHPCPQTACPGQLWFPLALPACMQTTRPPSHLASMCMCMAGTQTCTQFSPVSTHCKPL